MVWSTFHVGCSKRGRPGDVRMKSVHRRIWHHRMNFFRRPAATILSFGLISLSSIHLVSNSASTRLYTRKYGSVFRPEKVSGWTSLRWHPRLSAACIALEKLAHTRSTSSRATSKCRTWKRKSRNFDEYVMQNLHTGLIPFQLARSERTLRPCHGPDERGWNRTSLLRYSSRS